MGPKELKNWQERKLFADRVWKKQGLTEDSESNHSARVIMRAYRLQAWAASGLLSWGGLGEDELVEDPTLFSNVNASMAGMFARNPEVDAVALDPQSKQTQPRVQSTMTLALNLPDLQVREQWNRCLLDAHLLPGGIAQYGYTPPDEKIRDGELLDRNDYALADFPWIRRRAWWDVRIDPLVDTFRSGGPTRWIMFRELYSRGQIEKHPRLKMRRDFEPGIKVRANFSEEFGEEGMLAPSPEEASLFEVWWVWDKVERKVFAISDSSEKLIADEEDWPIPWRRLPYDMLQFNETSDGPFGVSYGQAAYNVQLEINKAVTMMTQLIKRMRRLVGVNESVDNKEFQKLEAGDLMEIIRVSGARDVRQAISQIPLAGGIQEVAFYIRELRDLQRIAMGFSQFDRGARENVESGTEAAAIAQGATTQRQRNMGPWETFLSGGIQMFAKALQSIIVGGESRTIPLLDEEDARDILRAESEPFLEIDRESIQGNFYYRVRPGSTAAVDKNQRLTEEIFLAEALIKFGADAVNQPQLLVNIIRAARKDPAKLLANKELLQALDGLRQSRGEGPPQESGGQGGIDGNVLQFSELVRGNAS